MADIAHLKNQRELRVSFHKELNRKKEVFMLRDTAILLLMQRSGNLQDPAIRDLMIAEMDFVQTIELELGLNLPWFLLSETSSITTISGEARLPNPTDFLREYDDGALWVYDVSQSNPWGKLTKDSYEALIARNLGSGRPRFYSLVGENFILFPTPDTAYTVKMKYYKKGVSIAGNYGGTGNVENVWLKYAPDLLIAKTGVIYAGQYDQSPERGQFFQAQAQVALKRVIDETTARENANVEQTMGD